MYFDNIVATANIYVINFRNSKNVRQVYLRNNNHLRDIYCWHLLYKGLHWLSYIHRKTGFIKCLISKRRQHVDLHKVLLYSRLVQYKIHVVIDSHLSQFLERTKHTKCINSDLMILKHQLKKNIPNKNRFRTLYSINFKKVSQLTVKECILNSAPKSCELDPIPSKLLIECLDSILPSLTDLFNSSLASGIFLQCFKSALVTPILKKRCLDHNDLNNYRYLSDRSVNVLHWINVLQLLDMWSASCTKISTALVCYTWTGLSMFYTVLMCYNYWICDRLLVQRYPPFLSVTPGPVCQCSTLY